MRTKTLLLTAALGLAGLSASIAQVYSVNIVGYVNKTYPAGYAIVNNPLATGTNTIEQVLPAASLPLFSVAYKFVGGTYDAANNNFGTWDNPNQTWPVGQGMFLFFPSQTTVTFVGEVLTGSQTNSLAAGYSMVGSKIPQGGLLEQTLGLTPGFFDVVYQFNPATQQYLDARNSFGPGSWTPVEPSVSVAEAFFYFNANAQNNWVRNFNP